MLTTCILFYVYRRDAFITSFENGNATCSFRTGGITLNLVKDIITNLINCLHPHSIALLQLFEDNADAPIRESGQQEFQEYRQKLLGI